VSVSFPHAAWGKRASRYCVDARPAFRSGATWDLEVRSKTKDPIHLTFEGVDDVPIEHEVWLVDVGSGVSQDLRRERSYLLPPLAGDGVHGLRLLIGTREYVAGRREADGLAPGRFALEPNFPNPFNPTTTIRFSLPSREAVDLRVYGIDGRRVATLIGGDSFDPGRYAVDWDGRSESGRPAASGVYFFRLAAGPFQETRKMVLVR
jgi:hypothetical protein